MSKDPTFRILVDAPKRSTVYEEYRKEWDRRETELDASNHPVHADIETVAVCDLRCGSTEEDPKGFCQIWTHEHIRMQGMEDFSYQRGYMDPVLYGRLIQQCADIGVSSIKFNYRGEPSLHPRIVSFIREARALGFPDLMMNTNGNGGARKNKKLFRQIVEAGITDLMYSVDACDEVTYHRQRVGGQWDILLNSVRESVNARNEGKGAPDLKIRASVVRTKINADDLDSGRMEEFWRKEMGVDWMSISECYLPAGAQHSWQAAHWTDLTAAEFQCSDPFRRMVVTWDGRHTMPCCQGFTLEIDGGPVVAGADAPMTTVQKAWLSPNFDRLRKAHRDRTWDDKASGEPICQSCAVTKKPTPIQVPKDGRVHLRVLSS
jgi:MoaA/NifB/PqqE/SkfB family radical SAM enzyme